MRVVTQERIETRSPQEPSTAVKGPSSRRRPVVEAEARHRGGEGYDGRDEGPGGRGAVANGNRGGPRHPAVPADQSNRWRRRAARLPRARVRWASRWARRRERSMPLLAIPQLSRQATLLPRRRAELEVAPSSPDTLAFSRRRPVGVAKLITLWKLRWRPRFGKAAPAPTYGITGVCRSRFGDSLLRTRHWR